MKILLFTLIILPVAALAAGPDLDAAFHEAAVSVRASAERASNEQQRILTPASSREASAVRCRFQRIEQSDCVYRCENGRTYRRPIDESERVVCPQLVWRF